MQSEPRTHSLNITPRSFGTLVLVLLAPLLVSASNDSSALNRCESVFSDTLIIQPKPMPTSAEFITKLTDNMGKKFRPNPLLVDVESLQVGEDYYLTPAALKGYSHLSKIIKEPIKMKVVAIYLPNAHKNWRGKKDKLFYFNSVETGNIAIESLRLQGEVYLESDYNEKAPFYFREYVQIGNDYSTENNYPLVSDPKKSIRFSGIEAAFIGKFLRVYDKRNYVIEVQSFSSKLSPTEIIVRRSDTFGLTSGTTKHFKDGIRELLFTPIDFTPGELIRFRDADGTIAIGSNINSEGYYINVKDEFGKSLKVSSKSIFRYLGGEPFTAIYNAYWIKARFHKPTGNLKKFLDAAGKLSSLPDFIELPPEQKILSLMRYLKANMTWTQGANAGEIAGLKNYNKLLCAGVGVCRHLAVLMSTLLSELGYKPRLTVYSENLQGHAWVEVDVKGPSGEIKTLVVDPSNGDDYVESFGRVSVLASKDKSSVEATWYVKPGRQFMIIQPE